jgi:hypothetical protein
MELTGQTQNVGGERGREGLSPYTLKTGLGWYDVLTRFVETEPYV